MDELEKREKEANIAKLKAEAEALKLNVILNIVRVALQAATLATAIIATVKILIK
ncbi:hypothetical protein ABMA58_00235 [Oceanospirillum sp. HFRX-1_2]